VQEADAATYLAQALEFQSREAEAEGLLRQSLAALEQGYGKVHPRVAIALGSLGTVAKDLNRLDEAEADFDRAFQISRSVYGDDHQNTAKALLNLASIYQAKKQFPKAEQDFRDVIRRYLKTLPPDHLDVGITRIRLGETLLGEKRYREAEGELQAGYAILTKQTSTSAWSLQVVRKDLAAVYDALKQPEKAAQIRAGAPNSEEKKLAGPSGN
jgi:serine/threonine-protein kinase